MTIIEFKSNDEMYEKEFNGLKNNTLRKVDMNDDRFKILKAYHDEGLNYGKLTIRINHATENKLFDRFVKDITFWDDYVIITWMI